MAFEFGGENDFEAARALVFAQLVEAEGGPDLGAHLHHPGRGAWLVLIGVRADEAVFGLLEEEGEAVERARRTQPGELVRLQFDGRLEVIFVTFAEAAVDAVGGDDDVAVGEAREIFDRCLVVDRDADVFATFLKDLKQR
jgi:hypothetical protein